MPKKIAVVNCSNCDANVDLKMNSANKLYWSCSCGVRQNYTVAATEKILTNLEHQRAENELKKQEISTENNTRGESSGGVEQPRSDDSDGGEQSESDSGFFF